ncbi:hypothetical protein CsatB_002772 [Cannabis sativa]
MDFIPLFLSKRYLNKGMFAFIIFSTNLWSFDLCQSSSQHVDTIKMKRQRNRLVISVFVDLRKLVEQNRANFIPPTSRMTNYILLKFDELSQTNNVWIEKWLLQCLVTCCCMFNLQAKLTICEGHDGTEFSNGDVTKVRSACDDDDQCKRQQRGPTIVGSEDVPLFLLLPA